MPFWWDRINCSKKFFVKPGVNISPHETPTLMHMTCEVLFYSTLQSFQSTKYYITSQGLCNAVGLEVWVGGESFMPRRTHIIGAHLTGVLRKIMRRFLYHTVSQTSFMLPSWFFLKFEGMNISLCNSWTIHLWSTIQYPETSSFFSKGVNVLLWNVCQRGC